MNPDNKSFAPIHDEQHDARKSVLFFLMAVAALLVVAAALVTWIQVSSDEFEETNQPPAVQTPLVSPQGSYKAFSASAVQTALSKGNKVVLFFSASWCPLCRATNDNLKGSAKNIPESVSIFTVDFDTASELKQKYDVRSEHTFVQLAQDGTVVTKWVGTQTLPDLLTKLK